MDDIFRRLSGALGERYLLDREIGAGGMATVYLARDLRHRRPVALKVVRPELGGPPGVNRFLREIELAARLQHPHILPVFDSGVVEAGGAPLPYLVMPYVEGETLRQRLHRTGPLPADDAVALAGEVADALAYAHQHGVVHRDVKPENILLTGGHAVVADFGVAKAFEVGAAVPESGSTRLTAAGVVMGTPQYMSPEQATGRDAVDARADQYSLGCVLYEMLVGRPPFEGQSTQAVIAKAMTAPRPRPSRARNDVAPALDAVVVRALAADPAERYPDMPAFAAALRGARGVGAGIPGRRLRWTAGGAVFIAAAAGAGWLATRDSGPSIAPGAESIAVLPFSASGPGVEFLAEGMVDLLATNLDGVAGIRAVDPRAVVRAWGERRPGADRLRQAIDLGRDLGAGSVVMGSAVSTGDRVRLAADFYSIAGEQLGRAQVDGPADSVLQLVDRLSVTLLRDVWRSREPLPSLDLAALTTDSLAALRAFLQGEQYYRRLVFDSALAAYTRATEVDSTFALAHMRRALVYGWMVGYGSDQSRIAGEAVSRFVYRLPPRDRRLLVGYRLFANAKPEAVDSVRAFLEEYPDALEAWFLLGESLYHTREYTGAGPDTIRAAFDSVIRRDSALVPAVIHPLELVLLYRDSVRFDRYARLLERGSSASQTRSIRTAAALVWGPPPSDSALGAALSSYAMPVIVALQSVYHREEATSDTVARMFDRLQPRGPAGRQFADDALAARADGYAGLGRLRDARVLAESLLAIPSYNGLALRWPLMLGLDLDRVDSARYDSLVRAQAPGPEGNYVRAVVALGRGDLATARRRLAEPTAAPDTGAAPRYRGMLTATRGWADLLAGDTATGLRRMEEGLHEAAAPRFREETALLRFQWALALSSRAESRTRGIQLLRHAFQGEALFVPLTYLALGRAWEAAGERDSAAYAYGRFLRLWDEADPVFEDRLREAREALQRLTAEPTAP